MDFVVAAYTTVLLVALLLYFNTKAKSSFPDGPTGVPFFGFAPFLGKNPGKTLTDLTKRYGPVMSINIVGHNWIVLSGYDVIHDAYVKQAEIFSGRQMTYFTKVSAEGHGLVFSNHEHIWRPLRKVGQVALKGFENGKKSWEKDVAEEAAYLVQNLATDDGDDMRNKLAMATANVISRVVYGSRFDYNNDTFRGLVYYLAGYFSDRPEAKIIGLVSFAPVLRHLPYFRGVLHQRMVETKVNVETVREFLNAHKATYDPNDTRDFIDSFLRETYNEENKRRVDHSKNEAKEAIPKPLQSPFQEKHLLHYINELFAAGTATTAGTLVWSILSLACFPEVQEKLAREIIDVLGPSSVPSVKHEAEMPYVCAFIQEIMRHRTLGPLGGIPHSTTKKVSFHGYTIPKDTYVVANVWSVHHDPNTFKNPGKFSPERFIDDSGKFIKSDRVIPFSIGQRHCLGKQLAKMEIFLFLTSIVQKFRILPHPEKPLPDFNEGNFNGISYEPHSVDVVFESR